MRTTLLTLASLLASSPLAAQEHAAAPGGGNILMPNAGVMFWTLVIFLVLFVVLSRFAFKPLTAAVAARERALQDALDAAKRDREEAQKVLAEHQRQLDAARAEAQRFIAEGRQAGEKMRADLLEQTRHEQQEMLERFRREMETERERAVADLRRDAVELAIRGASKVVERNLDDQTNRQLVENFLGSLETPDVARRG